MFYLRAHLPNGVAAMSWDYYSMKNLIESSSNRFAFKGLFDMPKRDGDTQHDWGEYVEPLKSNALTKFKKRNLTLNFISLNPTNTISKFESDIKNFIASEGNLMIDQYDGFTSYTLYNGPFNLVSGPNYEWIDKHTSSPFITIKIQVEIDDVVLSSGLTENPAYTGYKINDYPLHQNFGLDVLSLKGVNDFGNRIKDQNIRFYNTLGSSFQEVELTCLIRATSFADLNDKMKRLKYVLKRVDYDTTLYLPDASHFDFFVTDGFSIGKIQSDATSYVYGELKMKLKVIQS